MTRTLSPVRPRVFRRAPRGQAAVETALVMPLTLFVILGLLQLYALFEARFTNEYAAFRAARAGSLGRGDCELMKQAALQALLATGQKTSNPREVAAAWQAVERNSYQAYWAKVRAGGPRPAVDPRIIQLKLKLEDLNRAIQPGYDFDAVIAGEGELQHVTVELTYWYELRIPFANRVIHEMWQATSYGGDAKDPVRPVGRAMFEGMSPLHTDNDVVAAARTGGGGAAYLLPIRSVWSMRLMSNLDLSAPPEANCE